ncbi:MAG: nucleotide sugar dehydrogenase [Candidatus Rokuibacteriota bacterium]|nr:MAG: nucleotide sugar dehydrogenase [Candidatus Rokubacteria bacterium]
MKRVGIVGLGYVGITLAVALARKGCTVFGCDRVPEVVQALAAGRPHVYEPGIAEGLRELLNDRLYVAGTLPDTPLAAVVLCVSTPVEAATRRPNLEGLRAAARAVARDFRPDTLVVVRSTVPVGAGRSVVLPELLAAWGRARLAACPERTIQGQALRELTELPQIVGGLDDVSSDLAEALFSLLAPRIVRVSSLEAAEAVKLINNCHTDLIYSYGNEVALLAERLSLDPMELIRAANLDYPRPDLARPGFVGGGCLSKDPYILMASAAKVGHEPWLVGSARRLNEHLPGHVARRFLDLLGQVRGRLAGARVALLGFAYKGWPPTDDMRGAPVVPMLDVLREAPLTLLGHDFLVAPDVIRRHGVTPCSLEEAFGGTDGVLLVTDHPEYARLDVAATFSRMRRPALVYDCWRVLPADTVRRVGEVRYASIGLG